MKRALRLFMVSLLFILLPTACSPSSTTLSNQAQPPSPTVTNEAGRHVELEGGFSYLPPTDWQIRDFPGSKYKPAYGTRKDDFAPNINFVDESFSASLDEYVSANLEAMKKFFKDFKVIKQEEDFFTSKGERGIKIITENTQSEKKLRQVFYFFDARNKKIVVTYSRLAIKGQENDILADQSMQTFRVEK